jgi:hypothetical protein
MFYRLTHIDGVPVPATVTMDGRAIHVAGGGLLLEPPSTDGSPPHPDGSSILWLHGEPTDDVFPDLVIHSSEPYRWTHDDELDISRPVTDAGLRMHGRREGETLTVETEPAPCAVGRTTLSFVEAGEEPIPSFWKEETAHARTRHHRRKSLDVTEPEVLRQVEFREAWDLEQARRADVRRAAAWRVRA